MTLSEYYFPSKSTVRVGPSPYDLLLPVQEIVEGVTFSVSGPAFGYEDWNERQEQQPLQYEAKKTNAEKALDRGEGPFMPALVGIAGRRGLYIGSLRHRNSHPALTPALSRRTG